MHATSGLAWKIPGRVAALKEITEATVDSSLLNTRGTPNFNVKLSIVNAAGDHAGAALYGGDAVRYAVCGENGAELLPCEALIDQGHQFLD